MKQALPVYKMILLFALSTTSFGMISDQNGKGRQTFSPRFHIFSWSTLNHSIFKDISWNLKSQAWIVSTLRSLHQQTEMTITDFNATLTRQLIGK